jgi:transcriptional regulator with XRE-family HTH domain
LLAEYESSGLSREEFCRRQGVSRASLARYRQRQKKQASLAHNDWIEVEIPDSLPGGAAAGAPSGLIALLGNGRRIEVARGFDPITLERLLPVLERN